MADRSLGDKVRTGLLWSAAQGWGVRLISLGLFMVVARVLPPAELGLFALVAVVLAFLTMLADQGLSEALVQAPDVSAEQLDTVFWLNLGVSLLAGGALLLSAPWIAQALEQPALRELLWAASLVLPIVAAGFGQTALCKRRFEYRRLAAVALSATLVSAAVALALLALGWGIWSLVAQVLVAAAVSTASLWRASPWRPGWQADLRGARPLLVYGGHRLATQVIDFANTRYVEVFLAATLGPVSLAVYAVGVRLHQALMQAVSSAVLDVAHNGFSRLANDRPALMDAYYRSITVTATAAVPVFLLVAAVSAPLTAVVFGERWADSAAVMQLMALMGAVQVLQFYNGTVYNAIGRPEVGLYFMVLKVALSLGALLLARDGGLTLLVQAYVASQLLTAPLSFLLARRLIGVSMRQLARRCWPFLAGAGVMALAAAAVVGRLGPVLPPVLVLLLASATGCAVYLAWLGVLRPASLRAAWWTVRGKPAVAVKQG